MTSTSVSKKGEKLFFEGLVTPYRTTPPPHGPLCISLLLVSGMCPVVRSPRLSPRPPPDPFPNQPPFQASPLLGRKRPFLLNVSFRRTLFFTPPHGRAISDPRRSARPVLTPFPPPPWKCLWSFCSIFLVFLFSKKNKYLFFAEIRGFFPHGPKKMLFYWMYVFSFRHYSTDFRILLSSIAGKKLRVFRDRQLN